MTEDRLPLAELLAKAADGAFLRSVADAVVQLLMETDVEGMIGAGRHERSGERTTYRNGYRDRTLNTRLGSLQLHVYAPEQKSLTEVAGVSGCAGAKFRRWEALCVDRRGLGDEACGAVWAGPLRGWH